MKSKQNDACLPEYGHRYRLPFVIADGLYADVGHFLWIAPAELAVDYGMSKRLALCIQRYTTCARCARPPFPIEDHRGCKIDRKFYRQYCAGQQYDVEIAPGAVCQVLVTAEWEQTLHEEIRADYARINKWTRKHRFSATQNARERALQRQELFEIQRGNCYYCFAPLLPDTDSSDFDHFVSIAEGGTGDIWNLVVSCKECNHDKRTKHGKDFRDSKLCHLDKATRKKVLELQNVVDTWRKQKRIEHQTAIGATHSKTLQRR